MSRYARADFGAAAAKVCKVRKTAIHAQFNQWLQSIRHSDILTTSRYIDVNSKKLSEAAQRFKHWPLHKAA